MSDYIRRHIRSVVMAGGARQRERAAATVPFPDDIHIFIDEYISNKYGYPGIASLPRDKHLAHLTTYPYHIRRIPHSVHKLNRTNTDKAAVAARRSIATNALSFAAAAAQGRPVMADDDDGPPPPPSSNDSLLMKHAGLVGGFNIDDSYRYKVEKQAFRDSLIYEVRKWIDAYKKSIQQQQQLRQQYRRQRHHRQDDCEEEEEDTTGCSSTGVSEQWCDDDDDDEDVSSSDESSAPSMPPLRCHNIQTVVVSSSDCDD